MLPESMATSARGGPVPAQAGTHCFGYEDSSDRHAGPVDAAVMEALASMSVITHPAAASSTHLLSIPRRYNHLNEATAVTMREKTDPNLGQRHPSLCPQRQTSPTRCRCWEDAGATGNWAR